MSGLSLRVVLRTGSGHALLQCVEERSDDTHHRAENQPSRTRILPRRQSMGKIVRMPASRAGIELKISRVYVNIL